MVPRVFEFTPLVGDTVEITPSLEWEIVGRHHRRDGGMMLELDCMGADETTLRGLDFVPAPRVGADS
jgi:hypothetical protein